MPKRPPEIAVVIDNVRSVYNVGSIFRSADGFGARKIWVCGFSPTPEHRKMTKTSLGAEASVPWERAASTWRLVDKLKKRGYRIVALENASGARNIRTYRTPRKIALVVGHETEGVSKAVLSRADDVLAIRMSGVKDSFNVASAAAIAMYALSA